jgi:hypothetical protein
LVGLDAGEITLDETYESGMEGCPVHARYQAQYTCDLVELYRYAERFVEVETSLTQYDDLFA